MADIPQTDVSRPSALPTANLFQRQPQPLVDQNSDEYLDAIEEEWNKKVDVEIETLVDGMADIVSLASVCALRLDPRRGGVVQGSGNVDDANELCVCRLATRTSSASHRRRTRRSAAQSPWCACITRVSFRIPRPH